MSGKDALTALAAAIRRPECEVDLPGVPAERLAVYRELFFNTSESLLRSGFPVLHGVLGTARWQALVRAFLAEHRCRTPYFLEIGREFLAWLALPGVLLESDPAFVLELAHYERVELELDISQESLPGSGWSPLAWPLLYRWPVHRLGADYRPAQPPAEATCLLVWRDASERVRFQQLSPFALRLAQGLAAGEPLSRCLQQLAQEAGMACDDRLRAQAQELLARWREDAIYFGEA